VRKATILAAACAAAVLVPATGASAVDGGKSAIAKECAAQKKADKAAFRAVYGKHAMQHCIKGTTHVDATRSEFKNAAKECRAERDADAGAFAELWGSNKPNDNSQGANRNAFGKCVAATAQGEDPEETATTS
jgi:hypothetical protein